MSAIPVIDTSWHPLADGAAPEWADAWGQDEYGVYADFSFAETTQRMRWIAPGRFLMGSPKDEPGRYSDEGPQHAVILSEGYWLFDTPCTQVLWQAVMGDNPSEFPDPVRPVEQVSWDQAQAFIQRLNGEIPGLNLSLPTEAQWEYACRAGSETALYTGDIEIEGERNAPALDPIAWYGGNSGVEFDLEKGWDSSDWEEKQYPHRQAGTRQVKLKRPNAWGLYDMLGNVWEWCRDGWRDEYEPDDEVDPLWRRGARRVVRGGSWDDGARVVRAACRRRYSPGSRDDFLGFRCARVQAPEGVREFGGRNGRERGGA